MDTSVTVQEFETNIREMFVAADSNGDNIMTLVEFATFTDYFTKSVQELKIFGDHYNIEKLFETFD